ncbi:unnamed protein product [Ceutorhynchus assimilis]|uniref:Kinesin motor domain-containing protein n=1 Tax=Ceutorhynchus assimilis TaxID=467358 RepID=A0A9N9MM83_9CUCU|nr:unnamed protein product [Ceutorhynchus assimilis]
MEGAHRQFRSTKRRATPVPVAPPRVPTPMPVNNNNGPRSCETPKTTSSSTLIASAPSGHDMQQQQRLISKAPFRLLDNDVKTAWINPRLISKIDLDMIKKNDYVPSYERNINGYHHHHPRASSCGRVHDREWETPPLTSPIVVNGRGAKFQQPVAVPTSTGPIPEPSGVRRAPKTGNNGRSAKTVQMPLAKNNLKSRLPTKKVKNNNLATLNAQALCQQQVAAGRQLQSLAYHQQNVKVCESAGLFGVYAETKYVYAVNSVGTNLAQASAAAAFFASRSETEPFLVAAQKETLQLGRNGSGRILRGLAKMPSTCTTRPSETNRSKRSHRSWKVMLRVSNSIPDTGGGGFFSLDKRKKQVTLVDPSILNGSTAPEDRRVGVAAPKMFAFDAIFSQDDSQSEVCSSALTDVIHAVINGTDGCLFCFGHAGLGKSYTMLGTPDTSNTLGIIPCAISWLFKGINEQKQKTGARFSVRVSAVEVSGPTNQLRDLLAGYSNDSEQSPGMYLRDDPLMFGNQPPHCELRVPSAEKAAHYLDAAIEGRSQATRDLCRDSHLLFTLHVYQYSVAGKGGVAGGRSRLHLIDLGNSERGKASGGIPLSGLGNILLAIFNGQKHLPYKEHKLTHLLKDCLSSLTCHAAMIVHVSPFAQNYAETLTTVQLASRIHRMRRRRIKFVSTAAGNGSGEEQTRTTGTSSEPDPSSSDLSADTVIYVGRADDATDGEHPPVYIPSLNSGDNRCSMSKALRGSSAEQRPSSTKSSPKPEALHRPMKTPCQSAKTSPAHTSSPKSSPSRIPSIKKPPETIKHSNGASDEQWIDGPRISKSKVAEARHLMKEACHIKKRETWIDGPMQASTDPQSYGYMDSHKKNMIRKWVEHQTIQITKTGTKHPETGSKHPARHKELTQFKTEEVQVQEDETLMKPLKTQDIEKGVIRTGLKIPSARADSIAEDEQQKKSDDDDDEEPALPPALPIIQPLSSREVSLESLDMILKERMLSNAEYQNKSLIHQKEEEEDEDEVLEIIEVEEPLEPVPTMDSCLQVTEEDIALCMGFSENPLPEVDQENPLDHPLRILSQENLTVVSTFTDSMSVYTDLERILPRHRYERYYDDYEDPDNPRVNGNPAFDDTTRRKFDQLARLHELYTHRLAKATVANSETYQSQQRHPRSLTRCGSLTLNDMLYGHTQNDVPDNSSIYSEPAYVQEKFCENCRVNMSRPSTVQNWYEQSFLSASTQDLSRHCESAKSGGRFHHQGHCHNSKLTTREANLAFLRHPDGASNPNLLKETACSRSALPLDVPSSKVAVPASSITSQPSTERMNRAVLSLETGLKLTQKCEEYDSGHDSTPRTSKHSPAAISRRAESGYDSVVRDSESSSIDSEPTRFSHVGRRGKCKHKHEKSFCSWFLNPFTCKYIDEPPETHF